MILSASLTAGGNGAAFIMVPAGEFPNTVISNSQDQAKDGLNMDHFHFGSRGALCMRIIPDTLTLLV